MQANDYVNLIFQFSSLSHTMRNNASHSVHFKTHMQEEVPVRRQQCCNAPQPSKSPLFESIHPISSTTPHDAAKNIWTKTVFNSNRFLHEITPAAGF